MKLEKKIFINELFIVLKKKNNVYLSKLVN